MSTLAEEKERIVSSMRQIDGQLAGLPRRCAERPELIKQKAILMCELEKVKKEMRVEWDEKRNAFNRECPITDHALVRWLERKLGVNIERLRAAMLCDSLRAALQSEHKYWSDGEVVFVLDRGLVVTVIPVNTLGKAAA